MSFSKILAIFMAEGIAIGWVLSHFIHDLYAWLVVLAVVDLLIFTATALVVRKR